MATKEREKRRSWTNEETIAFLKSYKYRESEMCQPRKKMLGYSNILEDMKLMGILQSPATALNLQSKMSSLTRAFQCAILTEAARGDGTSGFQFMGLMHDIFTSTPSSKITLTSSTSASSNFNRASSTIVCAPSTIVCAPSTPSSSTIEPSTLAYVSLTSTIPPWNLTSQNEPKRGNWTFKETKALISCYASREDESQHPKKGKALFKNILEDLQSMNVLTGPTTESHVQTKWNSLLNAYKTASDTNKRTGRASSTFMYMDQMDEIFGNRPIMANSHTVNLYGERIEALPVRSTNKSSLPIGRNMGDADDHLVNTAHTNGFLDVDVEDVAVTTENVLVQKKATLVNPNIAGSSCTTNESRNAISKEGTSTAIACISDCHTFNLVEIDSECFINSDQPIEIIDEDIVVTTASKSKDQIRTLASKNIPVASVLTRTAIPKRNISIGTTDPYDFRALFSREEIEEEMSNHTNESIGPKSPKTTDKHGPKSGKLPYSFRRTKTTKEIVQEKKERWETLKLKMKNEARMEQLRFVEEKKQKRHEERCRVMNKIAEKM